MNYKKGILIFNILIPIILFSIILVVIGSIRSSVSKKYNYRKNQLEKTETLEKQIIAIKEQVNSYQEALEPAWNELLEAQISSQVTKTLNTILNEYINEELKQTGHSITETTNKFSANLDQPSAIVDLQFTGTYSAMQRAIAEFETRLPNFQLQSLQIAPNQNGIVLDFRISYIAWKKTPA